MINNFIKITASIWCGEITKGLDPRRKEFIIRKANIAMQMDHWDMMDGKPIGTSGDKIFQPKNEIERILWQDVRNNSKTDMEYMIRQRNNGSLGGRPKKEPAQTEMPQISNEQPEPHLNKKTATEMLLNKVAQSFRVHPDNTTQIGKTPIPPAMKQFLETEFKPAEITRLKRWLAENKSGETMKNESILRAACTIANKKYPDVSTRFLRFCMK